MTITATYPTPAYVPAMDTTQSTQLVRGTLTFSGNYVAGGDVINFAIHPVGVISYITSAQRPIGMQFWEEPASGTAVAGIAGLLFYRNVTAFRPGSSNGVIQIVSGATISGGVLTAGNELAASAYPASITGAKVFFEAIFILGR